MTTKALFVSVISRSSVLGPHLDAQAIATSLRAYAGVGGVVVQVVARPVVNDDQLSAVVMHVVAGAEDRDRCGDVVMDAVVVG